MPVAEQSLDELLALLNGARDLDYIGEPLSQLAHALQAATQSRKAGGSEAEIAAALLHDVGHLCTDASAARMEEYGVARHEQLGADYLAGLGFRPAVTDLVRGHVDAKRYLVSRRAAYRARLSNASRKTLEHQGGPMSAEECSAFEASPRFRSMLRLRACDEAAKDPDGKDAALESYRDLLLRQLEP